MTEALGIASAIKSKTVLTNGVDESDNDLVAVCKNEMIVTLISEILPAKGVQYVGPLPDKFQSYVTFAAGASPKAKVPAAGALFIKQLIGVRAAEVYVVEGHGSTPCGRLAPGQAGDSEVKGISHGLNELNEFGSLNSFNSWLIFP